MTATLVDVALAYAARGWPVIPLHHLAVDRCSCGRDDPALRGTPGEGCGSPAKHPRSKHGLHDGTTSPGAISAWWRRWPEANIGIVTGAAAGLVVVDVDPHKGGEDSLGALEAVHGPLPATLRTITGGNGMHIFFAHPGEPVANSAERKLGPGLDVRGDGGYVVAAPSLHLSGRRYEWIDLEIPPAPMPPWLLELLRTPVPLPAPMIPAGSFPRYEGGGTPYGLRALEAELLELGQAVQGSRNHQLNAAAFVLGQLVQGGELDEGLVVDELHRVAGAIRLGAGEAAATIRSGLTKGKTQPRSAPERPAGTAKNFAPRSSYTGGTTRLAPEPPEEPPYDDDCYDGGAEPVSAESGPPGEVEPHDDAPIGPDSFRQSDRGNARRLVHLHGSDLRYCAKLGSWLVWDGQRWAIDESGEVYRRAKDAVERMLGELIGLDGDARKHLFRFVLASESQGKLEAMVRCAQTEAEIPVTTDALDADPWLLNCRNGTVNLRSGELQPHRRGDLITKLAPVDYDPAATAPVFAAFLTRIMGDDAELAAYVQKAIGYALTGRVSEQVLFFLHGGGDNGKSTLMGAVMDMLGDYACTTEQDLLIAKRNDVHSTGITDLFGVRLALAEETEDGRRFDEGLVKKLTGGDRVKARRMRQDNFEWMPTHKLFLAANHKPVVRGTDHAIWRRLRLIPFGVTITDEEKDRNLPDKLAAEAPGILRWAVEGCLAWQAEGLRPPDVVSASTAAYRREMDVLGQFLADSCDVGDDEAVAAGAVYKAYTEWARANNEYVHSQKVFGGLLSERGFRRQQVGRLKLWTWFGLSTRPIAADDLATVTNGLFGQPAESATNGSENGEARPIAAHRGPILDSPLRAGAQEALTPSTGRDGPHGPRSVGTDVLGVESDWFFSKNVIGKCVGCDGDCVSRSPGGLILHPDCKPGGGF